MFLFLRLPGLAQSISPGSVSVDKGIKHLYVRRFVHVVELHILAKATLVLATVWRPNDSVPVAYTTGESIRLDNGEMCESEFRSIEKITKGTDN